MALKTYNEMRQIDVTPYVEDRDGYAYLSWNRCIDLLHANGAEQVYFLPVPNPKTGGSLYESETVFTDKNGITNRCYETLIEIHIDDRVYYMQSPVMNADKPVKDNSMSQQRVWNSMTRSFVKAVAIYTGLGFDLWLKEEANERKRQDEDDRHHDIMKVQQRVQETVTAIQKRGNMSLAQIAERFKRTEEELEQYLKYYNILYAVENNLNALLKEVSNDKQ